MCTNTTAFFFLNNPYLKICLFVFIFRERERNADVRNTDQSPPMVPEGKWNLQPTYVPWPWIEQAKFWCMGLHSNQRIHSARAWHNSFRQPLMEAMILTLQCRDCSSWLPREVSGTTACLPECPTLLHDSSEFSFLFLPDLLFK